MAVKILNVNAFDLMLHLSIYRDTSKTAQRCMPGRFIIALFVIPKNGKLPTCPVKEKMPY